MQFKKRKLILILILPALAACASLGRTPASSKVFNQPVVFEDRIVFLKPVVFKSGVEFRGAVQGRGAPYYAAAGMAARPQAAPTVDLQPVAPEPENPVPAIGSQLSVLTYNVKMWSARQGAHRAGHIEKLLREQRPDVVALQECGNWFYNRVTRRGWFRENYYVARPGGRARHVGGLALFSRYPIESVEYRMLPRSQDRPRYVLVARIRVLNRLVTVANVHLESPLEAGELRQRQMEALLPLIKNDPHSVLLGDFNFGDGEPEEKAVAPFTDLWGELRPGEAGYTWDREKSWMARRFSYRGEESRRLDRILVRSAEWRPETVRLFGQQPLRRGRAEIFASDHFGLLGTLRLNPHDA